MSEEIKKSKLALRVELPFWLRINKTDLSYDFSNDGFHDYVKTISINNISWKLYHTAIVPGEATVAYIGDEDSFSKEKFREIFKGEKVHTLWAKCKTVIILDCEVDQKILDNLYTDQRNEERTGLQSFIIQIALPSINHIIEKYRALTFDQMVHRLGAWDVPTWFAEKEGEPYNIVNLIRYKTFTAPKKEDQETTKTFLLTTTEEFTKSKLELHPYEIELLDAYNYAVRGDYRAALKSAVTAFEVALDAKIAIEWLELKLKEGATDGSEQVKKFQEEWSKSFSFMAKQRLFKRLTGKELKDYFGPELWTEIETARKHRHLLTHTMKTSVEIREQGDVRRHIDHLRFAINKLEDIPDRAKNRDDKLIKSKLEIIDFLDS